MSSSPPPSASPHGSRIIAVLALLSVFPPVATDMYLSSMPDLARALGASHAATELSLSIFFLGLCVGQILMGPVIDAFGRKPPLLVGAALFTLTSVALLLVRDVTLFNALRFVQAIGACAGMVVGRAMVDDLYSGREAARRLTVLITLMTLGPIFAPFLGSLLAAALGWQAIFVFMVLIGLVALALAWRVLPETLPPASRPPQPFRRAFRGFAGLGARPAFLLPALVAGLVQGAMFAFITGSSGAFQQGFGLSGMAYGLLFAFVALALILFGRLNSWLLHHTDALRISGIALPVFVLAGAGTALAAAAAHSLWLLVAPLWVAIGLVSLISANVMALAMAGSDRGAGLASALLGGIQFALAFLVSSATALGAGGGSALPMALGILLPGALALLLWVPGRRAAEGVGEGA